MAFDIYPSTLTQPLSVAANTTSPPQSFAEQVIIGGNLGPFGLFDAMFIRVAMLNPAVPCLTPGPPAPTIILSADGGTPVEVPASPTTASIFNGSAVHVADANVVAEANGVYFVEVFFQATGSAWDLRIRNNNLVDTREFIWVVAETNPEASQPWLDVSATTSPAGELDWDALIGAQILVNQTENHTLQIANRGTGPLTITSVPGQIAASEFEILSVPADPITPNACGDMVIAFTAPATAGESVETFSLASTDGLALDNPATFHNREVTLRATHGKLEIMYLLDTSGSMAWSPGGNTPPANPNESRWGRLKSAAKASLALLGDFADGAGRFGISMFPDITVSPVPAASSADFYPPADINAANVGDADASLDDHTPYRGGTPMGHGIARVIGENGSGNFEESSDALQYNRRWMILMTDGAHNSGPPDPADFYKPSEGSGCGIEGTALDGRSFVDKGVRVVTVAYGDDTGTDVNHDILNTLACKSDGLPLDAGVNDLDPIDPLAKAMRAAVVEGLNLTVANDPVGYLTKASPEKRAQIQVTPYDSKVSFVVDWNTFDNDEQVNVQLLTPTCELITPKIAKVTPDIAYHSHPYYRIYTIGEKYLKNAASPQEPRYGAWTLILSSRRVEGRMGEAYQYEVLMASRLKLKLDFDRKVYYAGDAMGLTAAVTLDGKPVSGAAMTLHVTAPGQSPINWLAQAHVTAGEYSNAAERFHNHDITTLGIKSFALREKGLVFDNFKQSNTIPMTEDGHTGRYTATFGNTAVTGGYKFYVTVTGQTEEGVAFRREIQRQARIGVRPDPKFTLFDVIYTRVIKAGRPVYLADIRVWPRDRFGNLVLTDIGVNPGVALSVRGGEFTGPLAGNLDGSYSRQLRYSVSTRPVISLNVAGSDIVARFEAAPLDDLVWADRIFDFQLGREAEKGANRHTDPRHALGEVTTRKEEAFVSLGAFGSLAVGIKDRILEGRAEDDVVVFVKPDETLRPYAVEALPADSRNKWISIGRSEGITQSFSLKSAGVKAATAIRIVDAGGRTLTRGFKPSPTPGVSILGVGFGRSSLKSHHWLGGIHISRIDGISNKYVNTLKFEGIETIADLADMDPTALEGALPMMRMVEVQTKARLALRTAAAIEPVPGLERATVWAVLTTSQQKLAAKAGASIEAISRLYDQISTLQLALDNRYLQELTIGELVRAR
ncbi:hypothetical protein [Desulfococcus sp.]|uniref:hypothetical protein n=1 Tax=Desulfococcus sp. TaxID=2025834 RepID=UPI003593958B